ncbi:hypothetical protein ACFVDN_08175 [Streptomyces californicus]|uniref:hypothetical protein n=1 Tax=Streptomyces californicus TaxID=67351 RepID=UPI0036B1DAAD
MHYTEADFSNDRTTGIEPHQRIAFSLEMATVLVVDHDHFPTPPSVEAVSCGAADHDGQTAPFVPVTTTVAGHRTGYLCAEVETRTWGEHLSSHGRFASLFRSVLRTW